MKQYNYLVVFARAPFGIGSAHITRTSKLDNFEKIVELAKCIEDKNNIKDVAIINFQLVGISRVRKEKSNENEK